MSSLDGRRTEAVGGSPSIGTPLFGVLPVDKPEGPTSHDVVAVARKSLGIKKVGHTGTLDPFASGLLLLALGPATRLVEYLAPLEKGYVATARLGETTETLDPESERIVRSERWHKLSPDQVRDALSSFLGEQTQRPPVFSAKKVGGEAAYRKARRGESVELEAVPVTVHEIELLDLTLPEVTFRVSCSTGTYVRALARDLGETLETGAYLSALRRVRIGPFDVDSAISPEAIQDPRAVRQALIPSHEALAHLPTLWAAPPAFRRLTQGQAIDAADLETEPERLEGPFVIRCGADAHRLVVAGWHDAAAGTPTSPRSGVAGTSATQELGGASERLRPLKVVGGG